jgi:hypothetical protein
LFLLTAGVPVKPESFVRDSLGGSRWQAYALAMSHVRACRIDTPRSRQTSGIATPASARLSASMIWLSVNFDFSVGIMDQELTSRVVYEHFEGGRFQAASFC